MVARHDDTRSIDNSLRTSVQSPIHQRLFGLKLIAEKKYFFHTSSFFVSVKWKLSTSYSVTMSSTQWKIVNIYGKLMIILIVLFFTFDLMNVQFGMHHSFVVNLTIDTFSCGLCTQSVRFCCPARLIGCGQSLAFCSSKSQISECGVTTECIIAWTFQDIGFYMFLQLLGFMCILTMVTNYNDYAYWNSNDESGFAENGSVHANETSYAYYWNSPNTIRAVLH